MAFKQFLRSVARNPIQTGALVPSSPALVSEMLSKVPMGFEHAVAEVGPGTGAITDELLPRLKNKNLYTAFDLNKEFIDILKERHPGVDFRHESGDQVAHLSDQKRPHRIVCSLPWTFLPPPVQKGMLRSFSEALEHGGSVSTFIYANARYFYPAGIKFPKLLSEYFSKVNESKIIWKNIPPAKVFHCSNS